jgi:hypothetical protein
MCLFIWDFTIYLYDKGIFKNIFIKLLILYYIIGSFPIEMIHFRKMEYNKSMKSGVLSNFYFQWYFLNLFKGHLYTNTIKGYSRVFLKNK